MENLTHCEKSNIFPVYFFRYFRFVSKQMCLFRLFRNGSETPKQTETNRKKYSLVSRNKPKINRNRLSFGLFRFEPKLYFDCFEDTLVVTLQSSHGNIDTVPGIRKKSGVFFQIPFLQL
jgi:hypothetical protein